MKYLAPIILSVLVSALLVLSATFASSEVGPSSRAEASPTLCVPSDPVSVPNVQPVKANGYLEITWENMALASVTVNHDGNIPAGFYSEVKVKNGKLASGTPSLPPRPGTCRTEVILNGPRATIKCHSNNCTTACGLYSTVTPNGESFYCECNYGPLPSPGPNPKPD